MGRCNLAQDLAWLKRSVRPQPTITLGDPEPPGSPHQAVCDQRIVDHENDERTQGRLRRQRDDLDVAFDR
jgi:hypothetical protein